MPNEMISYMYPLDHFSHCKYEIDATDEEKDDTVKSETNVELEKSRVAIVEGAQEIARRLLVPLSEFDGQDQGTEDDDINLLSSLKSALESLLADSNNKGSKNHDSAMQLLAKLYNIHVKVNALLWTRNKNKQDKNEVKFSLGQVVKHKIYGFRGFVSAWDRTPRIDVSNWDGLRDVKNVSLVKSFVPGFFSIILCKLQHTAKPSLANSSLKISPSIILMQMSMIVPKHLVRNEAIGT